MENDSVAASAADSRYELRGQLGEGGAGIVYRAFDRRRGEEVALKTLRRQEGRDLFRFKREFRMLADLAHPNLVALHELQTVGSDWMFTMELVEGVPFNEWVRPRAPAELDSGDDTRPGLRAVDSRGFAGCDEARLRDALAQLADGLLALHDAGKLHRDLKPSNVLVEPAGHGGRAVILDFGLVADVERGDLTHERLAVGTPAYMSPEQAMDRPLGAASDWYAVGVMLYDALVGRRPFEGPPATVLAAKQSSVPVPPRQVDPEVPEDLDALCVRLLARDPAERPDGRAVLAALGRAPSAATVGLIRQRSHGAFIGREAELAALREALAASREQSAVTVVVGASGIGKTSLIRRFLDEVSRDPATVVLEGRCFEREAVPYKTLDGVIDGLTAYLIASGFRTQRTSLRDLAALLRLFPVLRRVPWLELPTLPGSAPVDATELRRRALSGLGGLLGELAERGRLVIAIDDLQWGDVDGAAALAEVMEDCQAGFLVVASHRSEDLDTGAALAALRRLAPDRVHELPLGSLDEEHARALWTTLVGDAAAGDAEAVRDAAGSPLLLGELAHAHVLGVRGITTVDGAVGARVDRLAADARQVLRVVAVAGLPLRLDAVPLAAGIADAGPALISLQAEGLLRVRGASPVCETRHDRIRHAVVAALSDDERRAAHRRLAELLAGDPATPPEVVIEHWLGAGDSPRARDLAEGAARAAEERLAFHRAADLLQLALVGADLDREQRKNLLGRRGRALAACGRLVEAAGELRAASALAQGRERLELERLAVENLLKAGELDEGLTAAAALLAQVGEQLPRQPTLSLVVQRARLRIGGLDFRERAEATIEPATLDRLDTLWSVASGLSFVEPILGLALHMRLLRLALQTGEPRRVTLALGQELGFVALAGAPARHRLDRLLARGAGLARRLGGADLEGFIDLAAGTGYYLSGNFREGLRRIDAGAARLRPRPSGLSFQLDLADILRTAVLWWLGDLRGLTRWQSEQLRAAERDGNVTLQRHLSSWPGSVTWLIRDQADESHARIDAATPPARRGQRFHLHHYHAVAGHTVADLYAGRGDAARERIEAAWADIERARILRVQLVAIEARYLRGRAALAATAPDFQRALDCAVRLDRHGVDHACGLAASLRALIGSATGVAALARRELRTALRHFELASMDAYVAATRRRLGELLGGDDGDALVREADEWLRAQTVVDPDAFLRIL